MADVKAAIHCPRNHYNLEEQRYMRLLEPCHLGDNSIIFGHSLAEHMQAGSAGNHRRVDLREDTSLTFLHTLLSR